MEDVSHAWRHKAERWGVTRNEDIGFSGRRFDLVVRPLHCGISGLGLPHLALRASASHSFYCSFCRESYSSPKNTIETMVFPSFEAECALVTRFCTKKTPQIYSKNIRKIKGFGPELNHRKYNGMRVDKGGGPF